MVNTGILQNTDVAAAKVNNTIQKAENIGKNNSNFIKDFHEKIEKETGVKVRDKIGFDKNGKPTDKKLWNVCVEMESLFVKQMLNTMRQTVHKGPMFHGGQPEEIFEDMLYDEYSLEMSKNTNLGIAKQMYDQMSTLR